MIRPGTCIVPLLFAVALTGRAETWQAYKLCNSNVACTVADNFVVRSVINSVAVVCSVEPLPKRIVESGTVTVWKRVKDKPDQVTALIPIPQIATQTSSAAVTTRLVVEVGGFVQVRFQVQPTVQCGVTVVGSREPE